MASKFRPIGHDDRLSVVDHLDELRGRLIFSVAALFVVFCLCFWQNPHLLNLLNKALPRDANGAIVNEDKQDRVQENFYRTTAAAERTKCLSERSSPSVAAAVASADCAEAQAAATAARELPVAIASESAKPLTIGVGESFTQSLTVAIYFALLITAPLLLYQIYAFILPALHPAERRVALPAMIAAPVLFVIGVVFTYFEVLPPAVHFLQGYNSKQFLVLVQAGSYYKFEVFLMGGIGLAFEVPLILLALQRLGIISSNFLSGNWRYALVIIAVIVAALPGVDPVTMIAETVPLLALFLASIALLKFAEYRDRRKAASDAVIAAGLEAEAAAAEAARAAEAAEEAESVETPT